MCKAIEKNMISLLKTVCSYYVWIILSFMILIPDASVYAQDPDEEGEIFWGDEEDEDIPNCPDCGDNEDVEGPDDDGDYWCTYEECDSGEYFQ